MKYKDEKILIGDIKQNILVLNPNSGKPVLLIVHGGPGSPDRPLVCEYNKGLTDVYTVVCWDQRCSGLSYTRESKQKMLTTQLMLSDLKEVVEYLIVRFNQKKIYLAGHSWGAYLGLWFTSKYPQYVHYYIGTGQGISSRLDEIEKYNFVLKEATVRKETKSVATLNSFGVPINGVYNNNNNEAQSFVGTLIHRYGGYIHASNEFSMKKYLMLYPKFYGINTFKVIGGINYSTKHLTPAMKQNDIIPAISAVDVPVLLIFGENDYICPVNTAKKWFDMLSAPKKDMIIIKNAAHMVNFEQPSKWTDFVIDCVSTN